MGFHSAVISSFLLASAAAARSKITGGSLVTAPNDQTFRTVATSVNVPQLFGKEFDTITVFSALQSDGRPSAYAGLTCEIQVTTQAVCQTWFRVFSETAAPTQYFDLVTNPNDIIVFGITSPYHQPHHPVNEYVTYAFIENTNTSETRNLTSEVVAYGKEAGWMVANTPDGGTFNGIARFGQLEFTTTSAYIPGQDQYGPANGKSWDMTDDEGNMIATVKPSGNSMVVTDLRG